MLSIVAYKRRSRKLKPAARPGTAERRKRDPAPGRLLGERARERHEQILDRDRPGDEVLLDHVGDQRLQRRPVGFDAVGKASPPKTSSISSTSSISHGSMVLSEPA
jgi:hypothetical protein